MKKIFILMAMFATMCVASCGDGQKAANTEVADSTAVDTAVVDSIEVVDSVAVTDSI